MKESRFKGAFSGEERVAIGTALLCWKNIIETGSYQVGAKELGQCTEEMRKAWGAEKRELNAGQKLCVERLSQLYLETFAL